LAAGVWSGRTTEERAGRDPRARAMGERADTSGPSRLGAGSSFFAQQKALVSPRDSRLLHPASLRLRRLTALGHRQTGSANKPRTESHTQPPRKAAIAMICVHARVGRECRVRITTGSRDGPIDAAAHCGYAAPKLHPLTDLPNRAHHAVIPILAPSIQAVACQQAPPRTWAITGQLRLFSRPAR
jgi:hypothetical protein